MGWCRMKLLSEHTAPESFSRILTPTQACHELERHYLFGGAAGISISSRYSITRNTQSGIGVTGYREDAAVKRSVFDDLNRGGLLAIDEEWAPGRRPNTRFTSTRKADYSAIPVALFLPLSYWARDRPL